MQYNVVLLCFESRCPKNEKNIKYQECDFIKKRINRNRSEHIGKNIFVIQIQF